MTLSFLKPDKVLPTSEHNDYYSSDTNVAGTYVPNMSLADKKKWKAKVISGTDPRVEIRKTTINHIQFLLVVRRNNITMSANGKIELEREDFEDFKAAIYEALNILDMETARVK